MKDETVYNKWTESVNNPLYSQYFQSNNVKHVKTSKKKVVNKLSRKVKVIKKSSSRVKVVKKKN
jgi:hypothetical protein